LDKTEGFELEPRNIEHLPEMVDTDGSPLPKDEVSWFLNSFSHKSLTEQDSLMNHIQAALKEHNIEY
jgi:hypothetical protein